MVRKAFKPTAPPPQPAEGCDFETAVTLAGFGRFNLLLILVGVPSGWTSILETNTMSYVFPAAQCDLGLSLQNKGMLNAAVYIGMISSGLFWGFLADVWGRKKLLVLGYLLDGALVLASGFSQSFGMLFASKFLGGFIINGPFAAFTSYVSEFHSARYRARIMIMRGLIVHSANLVMPLLAWAVFPLELEIKLFDNQIVLHSWNVFLFISALPSLFCGVVYIFMPETPKFLMTKGRNERAMEVFKLVYSVNTGRPKNSYPVKSLLVENAHQEQPSSSNGTKFQLALKQAAQIFSKKYRWHMILICAIQFGLVIGGNPIKLWLPQIYTAINDYHTRHNETASLCEMLKLIQPAEERNGTIVCEVNLTNDFVYVNTLTVAGVCVLGFAISSLLVNAAGKKTILVIQAIASGLLTASLYFSKSTGATLALSSLSVALSLICMAVILAVVVDLFPTSLRTLTIAVTMTIARVGATVGNIIFPIVLESGCLQSFLTFGVIIMGSGVLSLFLPNTNFKALE